MNGGWLLASRIRPRGASLWRFSKEVMPMSDYEIINLIIGIIGLVITAVIAGFTIAKNNRH